MVLPDSVAFRCHYTSFLHTALWNYQRNEHKVVYSNDLNGVGVIRGLNPRWKSELYIHMDLNDFTST